MVGGGGINRKCYKQEFLGVEGTTWTYKVSHVKGHALSHWVLNMPLCVGHVEAYSPLNGYEEGPDGSIKDQDVDGLKWNTDNGVGDEGMIFSFTLDDEYSIVPVSVIAKASNSYGEGVIFGPSCDDTPPPPVACEAKAYAVHDGGLNNSEFFTIDPETLSVAPLGGVYAAHDIEALDLTPDGQTLYAASGDNTATPGMLYTVDKVTGALTEVGPTGMQEVDALSFAPDGSLWGWSQGEGLFVIADPSVSPVAAIMYPNAAEVEDISFSVDGSIIYGVQNANTVDPDAADADTTSVLWAYNVASGTLNTVCDSVSLGEIEALETLPTGDLIFGVHDDTSMMMTVSGLNPESCEGVSLDPIPSPYYDVEGIAWPSCAK